MKRNEKILTGIALVVTAALAFASGRSTGHSVQQIKNPNHSRAVGIFKPQTGNDEGIAAELRGLTPSLSNQITEQKIKYIPRQNEIEVSEEYRPVFEKFTTKNFANWLYQKQQKKEQ